MTDRSGGKGHKFSDKDRKKAARGSGTSRGGQVTARGRDRKTLDEVRQENHEELAEDLRKLGRNHK